jgi:tetratricopeptide (TPR) repeat protein
MQRIVRDVTNRLQSFLGQKETLVLLLRYRDEDGAIVFKILDSIDEVSEDVFWVFNDNFIDRESYVASVIESFQKRAALLADEFEKNDIPSWPPLPLEVTDPTKMPVERLRWLFSYARARMVNLDASHLIVALLPLEIAQPLQFRAFLRDLISSGSDSSWCHHMRLVTREPLHVTMKNLSEETQLHLDPRTFPNTEIYPVDFSVEALQKAMVEEMADPSLPLAERMHLLFLDASIDYAHKRYLVAGDKYQLLRTYAAAMNDVPLLAMTLNALGELHAGVSHRLRKHALEYFEMAVTACIDGKCYPLLLNVAMNLGNLYFVQKKWALAVEHFSAAEALATALLDAHAKLLCLEKIGICRYKLAEYRLAEKAWDSGATLARSVEENDACKGMLVHLRKMYKKARMRDCVEAIEEELRGLE